MEIKIESAGDWLVHLGVEGSATSAARGVEVDNDELVAGGEESLRELPRRADLHHVRRSALLPPPHRPGHPGGAGLRLNQNKKGNVISSANWGSRRVSEHEDGG